MATLVNNAGLILGTILAVILLLIVLVLTVPFLEKRPNTADATLPQTNLTLYDH